MDVLFGIIVFFLIVVLAIIGIGVYLLSKLVGGFGNLKRIVKGIFSFNKARKEAKKSKEKSSKAYSSNSGSSYSSSSASGSSSSQKAGGGGKIFDSSEGEYVDFEEIKDGTVNN